MEESKDKPERKASRRDVRTSPKAATLPAGAVLMAHPSEGLFTKIRRCLRLKTKGKYDLSHSSYESAGAMAVDRSGSSDSATSPENGHVEKPRVKSSPLKLSRRSTKYDKEEVVLVRKDKLSSFGLRLGVRSAGDVGKDDVLVVHVGGEKENRDKKENEASTPDSTVVSPSSENKDSDDVFDDFDPDYETLDNVRKKVLSQAGPPKPHVSSTGQPLPVRTKTLGSDGRDSGLGSPFTDSPSSGKDSQVQSVTSSMLSTSAGFSETSDPLKESMTQSTSSVLVNGEPALLTTSTCSNSAVQEDDLYSNSKVMFRKRSQKLSQAMDGSVSPVDSRLTDEAGSKPSSARNSLLLPDIPAVADENSAESLAPPPLPARNYSEEDIASLSKTPDSTCSQTNGQNTCSSATTTDAQSSFVGTGARPKTTTTTVLAASDNASLPQDLHIDVNPYADVDDTKLVSPRIGDIQTPDDMYYSACGNIYEDIPARADDEVNVVGSESRQDQEDDLMFIDEDPDSTDTDSGEKPVPPAVDYERLPDDVMIVSASDSMCGTETSDEFQMTRSFDSGAALAKAEETEKADAGLRSDASVTNKDIEKKDVCEAKETELKETVKCIDVMRLPLHTEKDTATMKLPLITDGADKRSELTGASPSGTASPELSAASAAAPSSPICDSATASSSSSSHREPDDPEEEMGVSSSGSSDTLNDTDNFDPDDLEGRDLNPPSGPPIHMTQQQVWRQADMRWLTLRPPVPPHRHSSGRASSRNAVSMDLTHSQHDGDDQSAGASSPRRHSGSSTQAKLHQDFLESMKQLKDCGWYWGPLSYEEAESKLQDKPDGSFLVRDSSNENYILSLSFKSLGQVHHTRIEHHKGLFSFWSQPDSHGKAQICQFIEQTVENSRNGRFLYFLRPMGPGSPPMPIQLLYPVSRFLKVPSLQHMCRFRVLRLVRRDHIDHLPLPQKVKAYLLEKQYYVETLEED